MQIKELLLGLPILVFIFWVFAAPVPQERISRGCEPVLWIGNIATSTAALSTEDHTATTVRWSDKLNYSCQYMVWRLFYQEQYNKAVAAGLVPAAGKQANDAVTTEKSTTLPTAEKKMPAPSTPAQAASAEEAAQ